MHLLEIASSEAIDGSERRAFRVYSENTTICRRGGSPVACSEFNSNEEPHLDSSVGPVEELPRHEPASHPSVYISPFVTMDYSMVQEALGASQSSCSEPPPESMAKKCTFDGLSSSLSTIGSCFPTASSLNPGISPPGPPHGVKAVIGRRNKMEDAVTCLNNFAKIHVIENSSSGDKLPARIALQLAGSSEVSVESPGPLSPNRPSPSSQTLSDQHGHLHDDHDPEDTLHFFGVYDGHGGDQAANHCAARLHQHLCEALVQQHAQIGAARIQQHGILEEVVADGHATSHTLTVISEEASLPLEPSTSEVILESRIACSKDSEVAMHSEGRPGSDQLTSEIKEEDNDVKEASCHSERVLRDDAIVEEALRDAFLKTDEEFAADCCASMVGSTAVVAILGKKKIWIANCGEDQDRCCSLTSVMVNHTSDLCIKFMVGYFCQ